MAESEMLSCNSVAKRLGISQTTAMRWINAGAFPNARIFKAGRMTRQKIMIPLSDLENLIRNSEIDANDDSAEEVRNQEQVEQTESEKSDTGNE